MATEVIHSKQAMVIMIAFLRKEGIITRFNEKRIKVHIEYNPNIKDVRFIVTDEDDRPAPVSNGGIILPGDFGK